jgi:hypothetical protein
MNMTLLNDYLNKYGAIQDRFSSITRDHWEARYKGSKSFAAWLGNTVAKSKGRWCEKLHTQLLTER